MIYFHYIVSLQKKLAYFFAAEKPWKNFQNLTVTCYLVTYLQSLQSICYPKFWIIIGKNKLPS